MLFLVILPVIKHTNGVSSFNSPDPLEGHLVRSKWSCEIGRTLY